MRHGVAATCHPGLGRYGRTHTSNVAARHRRVLAVGLLVPLVTAASLAPHVLRFFGQSCFVLGPKAIERRRSSCTPAQGRPLSTPEAQETVEVLDGSRVTPEEMQAMTPEMVQATGTARQINEPEFLALVEKGSVAKAVIVAWSGQQILAQLSDGSFVVVDEDSDTEDLRDVLVSKGITVDYPAGESSKEDETLGSEGAVASGILTAAAVGIFDVLEIGAPVALGGSGIEAQSLLEKKSPQEVLNEDLTLWTKDFQILERAAEQEAVQVESAVDSEAASVFQWFQDAANGIVKNHAPGIGGVIEDSLVGLLIVVSLYSLYQMAFLKRKSNSWSGLAHTATGAMQLGVVLYALIEERCLRESPGGVWAVFTFAIFMVNNITMWPLLKYFKGPEFQRVLFKLAYSFIISFQGIHAIAWSITYPWLYWVVMPFWYYSILKLAESSDNIFALLPDGTVPVPGLQESARNRVKGLQNDTPTIVYSTLNFAGAVFDNLYMAVYTWRGPAGFWGYSAATIPGINDHLRTALVKPAFGSLTISVLVFLATLVYRKKMPVPLAIVLNVLLASVGPWLILYYHKLIDFDEPWQPEIMGDWGTSPYFIDNFSELGATVASAFAFFGAKTVPLGLPPAIADVFPQ